MNTETIGVIGSGNTARALAAYLSKRGHRVCIYTRNPDKIDAIRQRNAIEATGIIEGVFPIEEVTSDPERLAQRCSIIFVATSEKTVVLLEQMEQDFRAVAEAYGTSLLPMKEVLNRYYGCKTESLLTAMKTVPSYKEIYAPTAVDHRFFWEDIACTLVPLQELARKGGVETPMVDAMISITSVLSGEDIRTLGRTLEKLGWSEMSHRDIVQWMQQ